MPTGRQTSIHLAKWKLDIPALIVDDEGAYLPLKYLCGVLMGTIDDRPHRARIKRDPVLGELWRFAPFDTPGGQQEMFCIQHVGLARWIDRIDINKVRSELRPGVLSLMWDITFAAHRLLTGEVESHALPMIIPPRTPAMKLQDDDVKKFLLALADRIGALTISQREVQSTLLALVAGSREDLPLRCPQCGYLIGEDPTME